MRTVLITGASRGFGRRAAVQLARDGWRVFATMRDPAGRAGLDQALSTAGVAASSVSVVPLDVTDPSSVSEGVDQVLAATGGDLDVAICNAGVLSIGAFEEVPPAEVRRIMETNFFGAIETARTALPALRRARGRLVMVSSDSGIYGTPGLAAYTASKCALEGWAESLAYEVGPLGVSVSLIEPSTFATGILDTQVLGADDGPYRGFTGILRQVLATESGKAPDPQPVIDAIARACEDRHPKLRYPVGVPAKVMWAANGVIPQRLRAILVRQATGMRGWRPV